MGINYAWWIYSQPKPQQLYPKQINDGDIKLSNVSISDILPKN